MGFDYHSLEPINNFLSVRKFRTKIVSSHSPNHNMFIAVPQGLIFFYMYIYFYIHIYIYMLRSFSMWLLISHKIRGRLCPVACGANMDLVLSKLEKDAFTVFTTFQNKYSKAKSRKSHIFTRSDNVLQINVGGNQPSSRKY